VRTNVGATKKGVNSIPYIALRDFSDTDDLIRYHLTLLFNQCIPANVSASVGRLANGPFSVRFCHSTKISNHALFKTKYTVIPGSFYSVRCQK